MDDGKMKGIRRKWLEGGGRDQGITLLFLPFSLFPVLSIWFRSALFWIRTKQWRPPANANLFFLANFSFAAEQLRADEIWQASNAGGMDANPFLSQALFPIQFLFVEGERERVYR